MAVLAHVLAPRVPAPGILLIAVGGVVGMLLDSYLGATVQGLFECGSCGALSERRNTSCHGSVHLIKGWSWLDNDAVNLVATVAGAGLALIGSRQ